MISRGEAERGVKSYWLSLPTPREYTALTAAEFCKKVKKDRPDLLEYKRQEGSDPCPDVRAWIWEYIEPNLKPPDR